MSHEYYLVHRDGAVFPPDALDAMRSYVRERWITHPWTEDLYFVFRSADERDRRLHRLNTEPDRPDYLTPTVWIAPEWVQLSSVCEPNTDGLFHAFVIWCQERWPCELMSTGEVISVDALLGEG